MTQTILRSCKILALIAGLLMLTGYRLEAQEKPTIAKELEDAKSQIALLQAQIVVLRQDLQITEIPEVRLARCLLAAEIAADAAKKKPVEKK